LEEGIIMHEKKITRRRFVAIIVAAMLAVSTLVAVPSTAFAADATTGELPIHELSVTLPQTAQQNFTSSFLPYEADGDAHLDFKIEDTESRVGTVNKHSGIFTADSPGVVVVTVYLTHGVAPTMNPNNPCYQPPLDVGYITVTVTRVDTGTYLPGETYQGLNQSFTVVKPYTGSEEYTISYDEDNNVTQYDTYIYGNVPVPLDGFIWDINMSYGTGSNFATWASYNNGNVVLTAPDGSTYSVSDSAGSLMFFTGMAQQNSVSLNIDDSLVAATGDYTLTFAAAYSAGNFNNPPIRTLEVPVVFHFSV
jgi:hypothetical protein